MHPLSMFPQLLSFGLLAPVLLRLTVGIIGLMVAWKKYKQSPKWIGIPYGICGLFLIAGLYTQVFSIIGLLIIIFGKYLDKNIEQPSPERKILKIVIAIILVSLLFTGPGFLAFDLPL